MRKIIFKGMKFISTILLLLVLLIGSCNHDDPDLSCNGRIKGNDLNGIQNCVRGSWKINYKRSAANGNSKTVLSDSFIKITEDDSIFYFLEGDLTAIAHLDWVLTQDRYSMNFKDWRGHALVFGIEKFTGDTLLITSNDPEEISYALTHSEFSPIMNCVGKLKDKALDQIRFCICGYWQMHYGEGGFTGIKQYFKDTFVEFKPSDSIYFNVQQYLEAADLIEWLKLPDEFTHEIDSTFIMTFQDWREYPYAWGVEEIRDDTLVLYENGPDGLGYYLTKKSK